MHYEETGMIKKIITLLLTVLMSVSVMECGNTTDDLSVSCRVYQIRLSSEVGKTIPGDQYVMYLSESEDREDFFTIYADDMDQESKALLDEYLAEKMEEAYDEETGMYTVFDTDISFEYGVAETDQLIGISKVETWPVYHNVKITSLEFVEFEDAWMME